MFGNHDEALQQLMLWSERPNSEYSLHRALGLKTDRGALAGILITLSGWERNVCHKADVAALFKTAFRERFADLRDAAPKISLPRITTEDYYIKIVSVAPRFRHRGLAKSLVLLAIDRGHEAGYRRFRLDVDKENLPACRLYESFGFSVSGQASYYPAIKRSMIAMVLAGSSAYTFSPRSSKASFV